MSNARPDRASAIEAPDRTVYTLGPAGTDTAVTLASDRRPGQVGRPHHARRHRHHGAGHDHRPLHRRRPRPRLLAGARNHPRPRNAPARAHQAVHDQRDLDRRLPASSASSFTTSPAGAVRETIQALVGNYPVVRPAPPPRSRGQIMPLPLHGVSRCRAHRSGPCCGSRTTAAAGPRPNTRMATPPSSRRSPGRADSEGTGRSAVAPGQGRSPAGAQ